MFDLEMVVEVRQRTDENTTLSPVGHLVLRRTFTGGQGAEMLGRLLGTNTALKLGNRDGSLWTGDGSAQPGVLYQLLLLGEPAPGLIL